MERLVLYRGKYCVYTILNGKPVRRSLGTSNRDEAERRYHEFKQFRAAASLSQLKTIKDLWTERQSKLTSKAHQTNYFYNGLPIIKFFGSLEPSHITPELCADYATHRRSLGIKDSSIRTELAHLQATLNAFGHKVRLVRPPSTAPKDLFLTKEQARDFINACTFAHLKLYTCLALSTGARTTALLELTWDRVDLNRRLINLRAQDMVDKKGRATVPINDFAYGLLQTIPEHDRVGPVIKWAGRPVLSVKKGIKAIARASGLPWVSAHIFRHSAAVWMAEANVSMEEIAQFLGHSDINTTRRIYARYSPEYLRKAAQALEL